ncbi:MAG TPA: hypothetical protein VK785_06990, partial [Opitutaceae bacterium]|nr:hypothetical protein [Opitutaceae bacterium]
MEIARAIPVRLPPPVVTAGEMPLPPIPSGMPGTHMDAIASPVAFIAEPHAHREPNTERQHRATFIVNRIGI